MNNVKGSVREYLKQEFRALSNQKYLDEWIASHLDYSEQQRDRFIIGNISEFAQEA